MQRTPTALQPRLAAQTRSSGPHHERVADPRCTAVASCSIGGCDPSSVITASLSFGVLCMLCHACGVSHVWRAPQKKKNASYESLEIWSNGHDARFSIFDGVSSSLAEFMSFFFLRFFLLFFFVLVRNPDSTDSTRAVQDACYNQLATTLYMPAACQQGRKQHHTRAVVFPRCITAVASYLILRSIWLLLLSDLAISSSPAGLCCCVIHACCHRYYNTDI